MSTGRRVLAVRHAVSYRDEPLLSLMNLPGPGQDVTPADARLLAGALLRAAEDCERLANDTRRYGPQRHEYDLATIPTTHKGAPR